MLIGTTYHSPRLHYAVDVVLKNYMGKIEYTSDSQKFSNYKGPKINYGLDLHDVIFDISPTDEIWNSKVVKQELLHGTWHDLDVIHWHGKPFDIFAATFFCVSRYEEYTHSDRDIHGRFSASSSVFALEKKYRIPLVDLWRIEFEKELHVAFPEIEFEKTQFCLLPTIDVDSAFAYKHKGVARTTAAILVDLVKFRFSNLANRIRCISGIIPDPFDTYELILQSTVENRTETRWFFLLSDFSKENINLSHRSKELKALIKRLDNHGHIGIHPGYQYHEELSVFKEEIRRLRNILDRNITNSRQHYLKMNLPGTYRNLIACEIENDFTMGFADDIGYRAGTAFPFEWYDLEKDERTDLMIHPFVVMDTTLNKYLGHTPTESIQIIGDCIQYSKELNLPFCFLWHNETLSEKGIWKDWRQVWDSAFESAL